MKILLVKKASGINYSLEAGLADGQKNFDHHGIHSDQPAPCADDRIPIIGVAGSPLKDIIVENDIEITHIDADTYLALCRMKGILLPVYEVDDPIKVDLNLLEQIDLNGTSVCKDKTDPTLSYIAGVGRLARQLNFPRVSNEIQDVTSIIEEMMTHSELDIIMIGREAIKQGEESYLNCLVEIRGKIGFWVIGPKDEFDSSRPYEDGIEIVIVHRKHWKTLSIYCSPESSHAFGQTHVAGILFEGHPKAAGSPRGKEFSQEDGQKCFDWLVNVIPALWMIHDMNKIYGYRTIDKVYRNRTKT